MTMYSTLLLDQGAWDLVIDSNGNIAMGSPPYSLSQDVASAVKLFLGELWYDNTQGVPYFQKLLGQLPPVSLIVAYLEGAAMSVSGVTSAKCIITSFTNRAINGQIQFIDETGVKNGVSF